MPVFGRRSMSAAADSFFGANLTGYNELMDTIGGEKIASQRTDPQYVPRKSMMNTSIHPDLLRGCPPKNVLSNFGRVFRPCALTPEQRKALEGQRVHYLDDFLSHEWKSSRAAKYMTLILIYNSRPALCVSFAVCFCMAVIEALPWMYCNGDYIDWWADRRPPHFCCIVGFLSFSVLLLCWSGRCPMVSSSIGRGPPRQIFLDKLCIDQVDQQRKIEGIKSLTGFLSHARRIVVLWTPHYFTRLWCTCELVSWLHLGKDNTLFMPLVKTGIVWAGFFGSVLLVTGYTIMKMMHVENGKFLSAVLFMWPSTFFIVHLSRDLAYSYLGLQSQLKFFSIHSTKCILPCDRELIYNSLRSWCGQSLPDASPSSSSPSFISVASENTTEHEAPQDIGQRQDSTSSELEKADGNAGLRDEAAYLEHFDKLVRRELAPDILSLFRRGGRISFAEAMIMSAPHVWHSLDILITDELRHPPPGDFAGLIVRVLIVAFSVAPSCQAIVVGLCEASVMLEHRWCRQRTRSSPGILMKNSYDTGNVFLSMLVSVVLAPIMFLLINAVPYARQKFGHRHDVLFGIELLCLVTALLVFYVPCFCLSGETDDSFAEIGTMPSQEHSVQPRSEVELRAFPSFAMTDSNERQTVETSDATQAVDSVPVRDSACHH